MNGNYGGFYLIYESLIGWKSEEIFFPDKDEGIMTNESFFEFIGLNFHLKKILKIKSCF